MQRPTLLERALGLARHGPCPDVAAIRALLKHAGYDQVDSHLKSRSAAKQLRAFCRARAMESPPLVHT